VGDDGAGAATPCRYAETAFEGVGSFDAMSAGTGSVRGATHEVVCTRLRFRLPTTRSCGISRLYLSPTAPAYTPSAAPDLPRAGSWIAADTATPSS
jgi:hypothetical protein